LVAKTTRLLGLAIVETLLTDGRWGPNNARPRSTGAPLQKAIREGDQETTKLLIRYGTDMNGTANINKWGDVRPLLIAIKKE
jgi:hypothetical protein